MSDKPKVYLAGPVASREDGGHGWRRRIADNHDDLEWVNPLDKYDGHANDVAIIPDGSDPDDYLADDVVTISELVRSDKEMIEASNALLVGWNQVHSVGTPMEVMYANGFKGHKPIVVWIDPDDEDPQLGPQDLSPWLRHHTDVALRDRRNAVWAIKQLLGYE